MTSLVNRMVQSAARPFGYAVVLDRLPKAPAGDMTGSKLDYRYLDDIAARLADLTTIVPRTIVEVGANYAQDAAYLAAKWNVDSSAVYLFEPHPEIAKRIRESYPFRAVEAAVGDTNGEVSFHAIHLDAGNSGISSVLPHSANASEAYELITVPITRLDSFLDREGIEGIDFLKIDVEGLSYEVLSGLGERIHDVKSIQLETEFLEVWRGQRTESQVYSLLRSAGFQLLHHSLGMDGVQADSLWASADSVRHRVFDISAGEWQERDVT